MEDQLEVFEKLKNLSVSTLNCVKDILQEENVDEIIINRTHVEDIYRILEIFNFIINYNEKIINEDTDFLDKNELIEDEKILRLKEFEDENRLLSENLREKTLLHNKHEIDNSLKYKHLNSSQRKQLISEKKHLKNELLMNEMNMSKTRKNIIDDENMIFEDEKRLSHSPIRRHNTEYLHRAPSMKSVHYSHMGSSPMRSSPLRSMRSSPMRSSSIRTSPMSSSRVSPIKNLTRASRRLSSRELNDNLREFNQDMREKNLERRELEEDLRERRESMREKSFNKMRSRVSSKF